MINDSKSITEKLGHYHLEVQANPKKLPFWGEEPNFQEQKDAASKFNIASKTSKGGCETLKKMSRDNSVSPVDAENSVSFLYIFLG